MRNVMIAMAAAAVAAGCCTKCGTECCGKTPAKAARKPVQEVKFVEIDPGHFHAALVLNRNYEGVSKDVPVFAPIISL